MRRRDLKTSLSNTAVSLLVLCARGDLAEIAAVRTLIDATCVCGVFDGTPGKKHRAYVWYSEPCSSSMIRWAHSRGCLQRL